jgi:hypothetical protein
MKIVWDRVERGEIMRWMVVITSMMLLLASLAGCSPAGVETQTATPSPPATHTPTSPALPTETVQPAETATPTEVEKMSTPDAKPPYTPALQNLIEKAREDLAQRLSPPVSQIYLVDAQEVFWPNSSLGCPEPGMVYAEVITPGYLIILSAGDREYEYHASRGTMVIYCENPMPPVPGMPGDT